jgi:hypothetical protein
MQSELPINVFLRSGPSFFVKFGDGTTISRVGKGGQTSPSSRFS